MPETPPEDSNAKQAIVRAAMSLCAAHGWRRLRMADIAQAAEMPEATLRTQFPEKRDILMWFYDDLEQQSLMLAEEMIDETVRDRLFAMMMERLDLASPYRDALQKMLDEGMPKQALCRTKRWLERLLRAAGATSTPMASAVQQLALGAIWAMVVPVWLQDDSADLSRTMASLDTQLGYAETAWQTIEGFLPAF